MLLLLFLIIIFLLFMYIILNKKMNLNLLPIKGTCATITSDQLCTDSSGNIDKTCPSLWTCFIENKIGECNILCDCEDEIYNGKERPQCEYNDDCPADYKTCKNIEKKELCGLLKNEEDKKNCVCVKSTCKDDKCPDDYKCENSKSGQGLCKLLDGNKKCSKGLFSKNTCNEFQKCFT